MTTADARSESPDKPSKIPGLPFRTVTGVARVVARTGESPPVSGYKPVTLKLLGKDFEALAPEGQKHFLFTGQLHLTSGTENLPEVLVAHNLRTITVAEGIHNMVFAVTPETLAKIEALKTQF